tara:strand:- start:183 stop:1259 length:1077 start_codon:yes stop_codon:yes gene_type:complete
MKVTINKFLYKDSLNKQRALFAECFPETVGKEIIKESHYFWKFHSFPSFIHSYEFGAFAENDLIGYYAAIPYQYLINNQKITVGMVCDVMTGPKARGKGVFTRIGEYSTNEMQKNGLTFTTGYPIREEVIPGHLKVGWEIMHPLPLYIKFLSFKSLFKRKKIGFLSYPMDVLLRLYNFLLALMIREKEYDLEIYNSIEIDKISGIDKFLSKWITEQPIALNKSTQFLKWRLGAPNKKYKIIVAKKEEEIVGYSVFTETIKENIPTIAILDISFLNGHSGSSALICRSISEIAKIRKVHSIIIMASSHTYKKNRMIKNGFIKSPYKFSFILKNLNKEYSNNFLKNEENWNLMWIDSDNL